MTVGVSTYRANGDEQQLHDWCTPRRLLVKITPLEGATLDDTGLAAHLIWRVPLHFRMVESAAEGFSTADRLGRWPIASSQGAFKWASGGSVGIKGGQGNWSVEIVDAPDDCAECACGRLWLTRFYEEEGPLLVPEGHSHARVLAGGILLGGALIGPPSHDVEVEFIVAGGGVVQRPSLIQTCAQIGGWACAP